jgi:hypothetical protein
MSRRCGKPRRLGTTTQRSARPASGCQTARHTSPIARSRCSRRARRDGMARIHHPNAFPLTRLAPAQRTARAHEPLEELRPVPGVQNDQSHARQHPLLHPRHRFIEHLIMRRMPPPEQNVRFIENRLRNTLLRLIERRRADDEVVVLGPLNASPSTPARRFGRSRSPCHQSG